MMGKGSKNGGSKVPQGALPAGQAQLAAREFKVSSDFYTHIQVIAKNSEQIINTPNNISSASDAVGALSGIYEVSLYLQAAEAAEEAEKEVTLAKRDQTEATDRHIAVTARSSAERAEKAAQLVEKSAISPEVYIVKSEATQTIAAAARAASASTQAQAYAAASAALAHVQAAITAEANARTRLALRALDPADRILAALPAATDPIATIIAAAQQYNNLAALMTQDVDQIPNETAAARLTALGPNPTAVAKADAAVLAASTARDAIRTLANTKLNAGRDHAETTLAQHIGLHTLTTTSSALAIRPPAPLGAEKAQFMLRYFLNSLKQEGLTQCGMPSVSQQILNNPPFRYNGNYEAQQKQFITEYQEQFLANLPIYLESCAAGGFLSVAEKAELLEAITAAEQVSDKKDKAGIKADITARIKHDLNAPPPKAGTGSAKFFLAGGLPPIQRKKAFSPAYKDALRKIDNETEISQQAEHLELLTRPRGWKGFTGVSILSRLRTWAEATTQDLQIGYTDPATGATTNAPLSMLEKGTPDQKNLAKKINNSTPHTATQNLLEFGAEIGQLILQSNAASNVKAKSNISDNLLAFGGAGNKDWAKTIAALTDAHNRYGNAQATTKTLLLHLINLATALKTLSTNHTDATAKANEAAAETELAKFASEEDKQKKIADAISNKYGVKSTASPSAGVYRDDKSDTHEKEAALELASWTNAYTAANRNKIPAGAVTVPLGLNPKYKQLINLYHRTGEQDAVIIQASFRINPLTGNFFLTDKEVKDRLIKLMIHDNTQQQDLGDSKLATILNSGKITGLPALGNNMKYICEPMGDPVIGVEVWRATVVNGQVSNKQPLNTAELDIVHRVGMKVLAAGMALENKVRMASAKPDFFPSALQGEVQNLDESQVIAFSHPTGFKSSNKI